MAETGNKSENKGRWGGAEKLSTAGEAAPQNTCRLPSIGAVVATARTYSPPPPPPSAADARHAGEKPREGRPAVHSTAAVNHPPCRPQDPTNFRCFRGGEW